MDENRIERWLNNPQKEPYSDGQAFRILLTQWVDELIGRDFSRLCQLLYRVDVEENYLKQCLEQSSQPPAEIIADLLLERQKQKVALRADFRMGAREDIPEEDRW